MELKKRERERETIHSSKHMIIRSGVSFLNVFPVQNKETRMLTTSAFQYSKEITEEDNEEVPDEYT